MFSSHIFRKGPYTESIKGKDPIVIKIEKSPITIKMEEKSILKLETQLSNALKSNVILEALTKENLAISLSFNLIECDCDILPYLINTSSIALISAGIMQRSILAASSVVCL